jgi:hypothetical protein
LPARLEDDALAGKIQLGELGQMLQPACPQLALDDALDDALNFFE